MPEEKQTKEQSSPDTTGEVMPTPASPLTWWLSGGALVVVGAVVAAILFTHSDERNAASGHEHAAGHESPAEKADEEHDVEQIAELVHHTNMAHQELQPLVEALDRVLPPDGPAPSEEAVDAAEVDQWQETVHEAVHHFEEIPSGEAGYNVALTGLANAVELLGSAVGAYASAQEVAGTQRDTLLELASDLRTQAVNAWSVAATQLDVLSSQNENGHVHLYLPAAPDSGALEPDAEEGAPTEEVDGHDH